MGIPSHKVPPEGTQCKRKGCERPADYICRRNHIYCWKHARMYLMQRSSSRRNKYAPTFEEFETKWPDNMKCTTCSKQMVYHKSQSQNYGDIATIQHWGGNVFSIICHYCNNREGHSKNRDRVLDTRDGWRICSTCGVEKPLSAEFFYRSAKDPAGLQYKCKVCRRITRNDNAKTAALTLLRKRMK